MPPKSGLLKELVSRLPRDIWLYQTGQLPQQGVVCCCRLVSCHRFDCKVKLTRLTGDQSWWCCMWGCQKKCFSYHGNQSDQYQAYNQAMSGQICAQCNTIASDYHQINSLASTNIVSEYRHSRLVDSSYKNMANIRVSRARSSLCPDTKYWYIVWADWPA